MGRRALPVLLAAAAALADGRGAHGLALDALLAAVPFTAVAALVSFGSYLEGSEQPFARLQAMLWGLVLALVVLSCAVRSAGGATHTIPPLAGSALAACLAVLALKAFLALAPYARLALRPAKP